MINRQNIFKFGIFQIFETGEGWIRIWMCGKNVTDPYQVVRSNANAMVSIMSKIVLICTSRADLVSKYSLHNTYRKTNT